MIASRVRLVSSLQFADEMIGLAQEAKRAGLMRSATDPVALVYAIFNDGPDLAPRPGLGERRTAG